MFQNYDDCSFPSPFDDDFSDYPSDKEKKILEMREYAEGIKESIFQTGNVDDLVSHLEELCFLLDVDFNVPNETKIAKKYKSALGWYIENQKKIIRKKQYLGV